MRGHVRNSVLATHQDHCVTLTAHSSAPLDATLISALAMNDQHNDATEYAACIFCEEQLPLHLARCTACGAEYFPNVRESGSTRQRLALTQRFSSATKSAHERGTANAFETFVIEVKTRSRVLINVPLLIARELIHDRRNLYTSYEQLVNAKARTLAAPLDDRQRRSVAATLFGSHHDDIVYGALGIKCEGLTTYGPVTIQLSPLAVERRVSFLEANSYAFVRLHRIVPGDREPNGHRATWDNRHELAGVKCEQFVMTTTDAHSALLRTDGVNRELDEMIEAHISHGFGRGAIEALAVDRARLTAEEKQYAELLIDAWGRLKKDQAP